MALTHFIAELRGALSAEACVLSDPTKEDFQLALLRWSDVDVKIPGAIVQVANESDAVKLASAHRTPFVLVCGGHSLWSTIGPDGFILDLTKYKSVQVNAAEHQVTVAGGVLMKEFATALASAGECAPVGNGNTIGLIPYCLGGGIGVATGLMGIACDNIRSAKIVLANGQLVVANERQHPELFWAIKGAGYYFGLILEITLATYPLSVFGTPEGQHWIGNYLYPMDRAAEVFKVVESLVATSSSRTAGLVMLIAPPPHHQPMIAVVPHYFGDLEDGPKVFKELAALGPMMQSEKAPHVPNLSDHLDFACGKGGLRRFNLTGLQEFKIENCLQLTEVFQQLLESCPDASSSGYFIEWHCLPPHDMVRNSAFSHQSVHLWLHCLSWCQEQTSLTKVFESEARAIDAMRQGTEPDSYIDLPHGTRTHPIERRFPDRDTLAKLRALKKEFDPEGTFTKELL
ncbi:hypothetical protein XPA_002461 [Xanthoria parietina]